MKLFLKKFAFIGFISLFLIGIVGCNPTTEAEATDLEKVQAVLATIDLTDLSSVSADLTLPAPTTDGVTVTWSSSDTDFVSDAGVVTIPTFVEGEQEVVLTVTATLNEATESKTFTVTVSSETAEAFFTRAGAAIIIDGSDQITDGFLLPSLSLGASVAWESSNTDIVSISSEPNEDGFYVVTVNRPSADDGGVNTTVTLTATLTFGTATGTATKTLRVMAEESSVKVTTIAEGMALGAGEYVTYQGMTILGKGTDGFFFTDGVKILFVYAPTLLDSVQAGSVYDITGSLAYYYFGPQLANDGTNVVKVVASTAAVSTFTPVVATVSEALDNHPVPTTNDDPMVYTVYELTAKVYVGADLNDGYDVYLVPSDYDVSVPLDLTVTDAIRIYYKSNIDAVRALSGQVITLDLMLYNYHTSYGDWYSYFFGTVDDIQVSFASDTEAVAAALAALVVPTEVLEATTIDLPGSLFGVTLTYASDNEAIINPTTGVVDLTGLTAQATVTITVTATRGDVTDTATFTVKVGETPLTTIAAAIANVNNTVRFQGIVTELNGNNAYVQDESGAVYLYLGSNTAFADILVVGNIVEVEGKMYNYHNLMEISPVTTITLVSTGNTLPTPVEVTTADNALLLQNISKLVNVSGLVVKSIPTVGTSSYTIYLTDGTNDVQLRVDKYGLEFAAINTLVASLTVGQPVSLNGIAVGVYDANPQLMWLEASELVAGTVTDQTKVDFDAFAFPSELTLEGDYTFPTLNFAAVSAVVSSELNSYLTATSTGLTFVAPEGSDVTGTVTFTLTLNEITKEVVVNVTAKAITDADKLAFDLAALEVADTATEYDVITLPVLGAKGSAIAWVLNTGTATLDGAALTIGVVGTAFDVTLTATLTIGSETAVTKDFTIAVSPVVIVTDFSTIPAMTDGVKLYVQGTVVAIGSSYDGTWLQDSAGNGFFLYKYFGATVGDEILVSGTLGSYHSAKQMLATATLVQTVSTGATPVFATLTADEIVALTGDNAGKAISFTGLEVYSISSSTAVFKVTGTTANIYLKTYISDFVPWAYQVYQVGDILPAATFVFYNIETSLVEETTQLKVGAFKMEFTDQLKVEVDQAAMPATLELIENYTLPVPTYAVLTVKEISTELTSYVTDGTTALNVVLPAEADVTGTVTFTYTLNEVVVDVVVAVTVKAMTEAAKLADAVAEIPTTLGLSYHYTIPALYGSTFSNLVVPAELTGYVTLSADGLQLEIVRPSGTADITATVTLTVTVGASTQTVDIALTVLGNVDLFFSEYIEGGSSNKAIEIYNPTGVDVDLTGYSIELYSNGSATASVVFDITGTLLAGDVLVIANSLAIQTILDQADFIQSYPSVPNWNGDDAVVLKYNGIVIDSFGQVGYDPGSAWTVNTITTVNKTLVIKSAVTVGDVNPYDVFDPSANWDMYDQDTTTYLGSYEMPV